MSIYSHEYGDLNHTFEKQIIKFKRTRVGYKYIIKSWLILDAQSRGIVFYFAVPVYAVFVLRSRKCAVMNCTVS